METARAVGAKIVPPPTPLLSLTVVSTIAVLLTAVATGYAVRELRLAQGERGARLRLPVLLFAGFCLFMVFGWGFF